MASDFDNQDPAAVAAPTPEESETKTDGKAGAKSEPKGEGKAADAKSADPKSGDSQPSADKTDIKAGDANGKAEPSTGQPGGRKRHGAAAPQANQKNGTRWTWWSSRT